MASAVKNNVTESESGLNKWQLALCVGVPVAVGATIAGVWYYKKGRTKRPKSGKSQSNEGENVDSPAVAGPSTAGDAGSVATEVAAAESLVSQ